MRRPRTTFANPVPDNSKGPGLVEKLQSESDGHLAEARFPDAIATSRRLLAVLEVLDDPRAKAAAEIVLGTALMACGKPREAVPSFSRARTLLRACGLPGDMALAYFNIGMDFGRMKRLSLAKSAFLHSAKLYREMEQQRNLRQCQVFLAHTLLLLGALEEAREALAEAAQGLDLLDAFDRMTFHQTEAAVHLGQGRLELAEIAFARRYLAGSNLGDRKIMADSLYSMALLQQRLGDSWAAQSFLTEAKECIAGLGYWEAESRIQSLLLASRGRKSDSLKRLAEPQPFRRCS